jgi:hypothetical protein
MTIEELLDDLTARCVAAKLAGESNILCTPDERNRLYEVQRDAIKATGAGTQSLKAMIREIDRTRKALANAKRN